MDSIIKRIRQFSTGAGLATLIFLGAQFGVEDELIKAIMQALIAVVAVIEIVRNEGK